jgi:heterodisulfide reductase subunit A
MDNIRSVAVIGGGITGLQASLDLAGLGLNVCLIEKEKELGGNLKKLYKISPSNKKAQDLLDEKLAILAQAKNITVFTDTKIMNITGQFPHFKIRLSASEKAHDLDISAIALTTGFKPYDPSNEKEYGYKRLKNIITAPELEEILKKGSLTNLAKITFIQCVGSRSIKNNEHCSAFCCLYAIKNALLIKQSSPRTDVRIMYMDIRTPFLYEHVYREAREAGVKFIRSRPSVIFEQNGILTMKLEDTLTGENLIIDSDLVVLSVGAIPSEENMMIAQTMDLELGKSGFFNTTGLTSTNIKGIFTAGAACGPKNTSDSLSQASAMAMQIVKMLTDKNE